MGGASPKEGRVENARAQPWATAQSEHNTRQTRSIFSQLGWLGPGAPPLCTPVPMVPGPLSP